MRKRMKIKRRSAEEGGSGEAKIKGRARKQLTKSPEKEQVSNRCL